MNLDIFLYVSQFLTLRDKMNLAQICKNLYQASLYMYKDQLVIFASNNKEWVSKYKPRLYVTKNID